MSPLERFSKWIQLKIYQLEVTYSVYIFTPAEKFVFYSVLFLLFSLSSIAVFLYLPQHIAFLAQRAWFYVHGDALDAVMTGAAATSQGVVKSTAIAIQEGVPTMLAKAAATTAAAVKEEL